MMSLQYAWLQTRFYGNCMPILVLKFKKKENADYDC